LDARGNAIKDKAVGYVYEELILIVNLVFVKLE
jgi:hypothetical protein